MSFDRAVDIEVDPASSRGLVPEIASLIERDRYDRLAFGIIALRIGENPRVIARRALDEFVSVRDLHARQDAAHIVKGLKTRPLACTSSSTVPRLERSTPFSGMRRISVLLERPPSS